MKRNREVYSLLWDKVIAPEIEELSRQDMVTCGCLSKACDDIWDAYVEFNIHASNTYLNVPDAQIDRHKVAACYMCAIMDAMPLDVSGVAMKDNEFAYLSNERLAVTTGVSTLGMFDFAVLAEIEAQRRNGHDPELSEAEVTELEKRISRGIDFKRAFPTRSGSYYESVLSALSFMKEEGSYNVPLLALLMFHWERALVGAQHHLALMSIRKSVYNTQGI